MSEQIVLFFLGAITSGIFFVFFIKYLYAPVRDYIKSYFLTHQLLKETRPTRNARRGKYLADRLLDIWNNGNPKPLISRDTLYMAKTNWEGVWSEKVVDEKLKEKGLVEIFQSKGNSHVRLSDSTLTRMVIKRLVRLVNSKLL